MPSIADSYAAIGVLSTPFEPPAAATMTDAELMHAQRALAEIARRAGAAGAALAGEVAHRSRPELGSEGLAQRLGARTPELLVQRLTETSAPAARSLVRVGRLLETQDAGVTRDPDRTYAVDGAPWLAAVAAAVVAGHLSVERADVIRCGLGSIDAASSPAEREHLITGLTAAVDVLLRESVSVTLERLAVRARVLRADLDDAGNRDREQRLRARRFLHLVPQADGMTRLSGLLDPESAAIVRSAFDAATSPRRGGPRFVDPVELARAEALASDERTVEQIAVDAFVELIRIGGETEGAQVLGTRRPAVQVVVAERDLTRNSGRGFLEGQTEPVSIETVRRHVCAAGIQALVLDASGQPMRMGRTSRLFTRAQRLALAVRDGGCRFPGCDRPPSWTEAHHPDEWERDHGKTDIENGILLCRHHHLLIHNAGWKVIRRGAEYFVKPPTSVDPRQAPIPAPSRSEVLARVGVRVA
jgi:hypothetical protein